MGNIFEVIVNFIEAVINAQFLIRYLNTKNGIKKHTAYAVMIVTQFLAVTVYNKIAYIRNYGEWILMILWFLCSVLLLKGRIMEKLFLVGMHNVIICVTEIVLLVRLEI